MGYLLGQLFFYLLGALALGVLAGWILWGRLRGETTELQAEAARLRNETERLRAELEACGRARAELEGNLATSEGALADLRALSAAGSARVRSATPATQAASIISNPVRKPSPAPKPAPKPAPLRVPPPRPAPVEPPEDHQPQLDLGAGLASPTVTPSGSDAPTSPRAGGEAAAKKPPRKKAAAPQRLPVPDDLRRIVGIGPVNERLLHGEGVHKFAQIAAWTDEDVRRIEDVLQFDGRIERERWIEQAKLLAAGDEQRFAEEFPSAGSDSNT